VIGRCLVGCRVRGIFRSRGTPARADKQDGCISLPCLPAPFNDPVLRLFIVLSSPPSQGRRRPQDITSGKDRLAMAISGRGQAGARANQTGGRDFPAAARIGLLVRLGLLLRLGWIIVRRRETGKELPTRSVLQDATAASRALRGNDRRRSRATFFFGAHYGVDRNSVGAMFPASLLVLNCWRDS